MTDADLDLDDLAIKKMTRQAAGNGTWVCGTLDGHCFSALVFPEHAEVPDYEIGKSRISKLWIQRLADRRASLPGVNSVCLPSGRCYSHVSRQQRRPARQKRGAGVISI